MNLKNNLSRAEVLFKTGQYQESLSICEKILNNKSNVLNAFQIMGLNYHALHVFDKAIECYEAALKIDDKHASCNNNLGNVYLAREEYVKASKYFAKAFHIDPSMAQAHNNFALCQLRSGKLELAESHYKKAILHDATIFEFYNNLGSLYSAQGKFESALEFFIKSLECEVKNPEAYWESFRAQLYMHRYQDAIETADLAILSKTLRVPDLCSFLVGKAIVYWLFNCFDDAKQAIEQSSVIYQYEEMSSHMKNMTVFHRYIKKLLEIRDSQIDTSSVPANNELKEMYFISESHGFAPNGAIVNYQGSSYQIRSLFIMGAKIFHLIAEEDNKYQVSLARLLEDLPKKSKVVLGFGEIDCRNNEGIFAYCEKSGKDFKAVIDNMINKYIDTLKNVAKVCELDILLYGVPAPHPIFVDQLDDERKEHFKAMIAYYNRTLQHQCCEHQIDFIDVYRFTNENGQSNLEHHIDYIHLHPDLVPKIFNSMT